MDNRLYSKLLLVLFFLLVTSLFKFVCVCVCVWGGGGLHSQEPKPTIFGLIFCTATLKELHLSQCVCVCVVSALICVPSCKCLYDLVRFFGYFFYIHPHACVYKYIFPLTVYFCSSLLCMSTLPFNYQMFFLSPLWVVSSL